MPSLAIGSKKKDCITIDQAHHSNDDIKSGFFAIYFMDKQLDAFKKIYQSITGNRQKGAKLKEDDGTLLFLKPHLIYDNNKQNELDKKIPPLIQEIKREEIDFIYDSVDDAREEIDERKQYAAVIDKAVDLQIFEENRNHFEQIEKILTKVDTVEDIKGTAELKLQLEGMLSMIQNEKIKLEAIAHSRDVEQVLIKQLQYKRNAKILRRTNKQMPTVRSR